MSLVNRKRRPIKRDPGKLRDAWLFVIATEDTYAPKQYFEFNYFSHQKLRIEVLETLDGKSSPSAVVERLKTFADEYQIGEGDQLWVLLDTDHWIEGSHRNTLVEAIKECRRRGFKVAMSNPCFDFWLLLHHEEIAVGSSLTNCDLVGMRIRELKGEFNKKNLKDGHYSRETISLAWERAKLLEIDLERSSEDFWPKSIGSRVWLLIEELRIFKLLS